MKFRPALTLLLVTVLTVVWPITAAAYVIADPDHSAASGAQPRLAVPKAPLAPLVTNGSWPVYHRDNAHTGFDPTLSAAIGATAGWTSPVLDDQVFASPLIYGGIVYAATLNNTVYALNQSDGSPVWSRNLRVPEAATAPTPGGCGNVAPQGILGTPVVDPGTNRIYVVTLSGVDDHFRLEGLNLGTGVPEMATDISAYAPTLDWIIQQQRGALTIANGYVYVPFGGRAGDCGNYHGWVFAVPTNGGAITHHYVTPGSGAGFWATGGVVIDNSTNKVFATSGNGTSGCAANPDGSPVYEENAVVRLSAILAREDAFVPQDWVSPYCALDQDLGGAGPLLISPNLLFQAGKAGGGFLLNPNALGGLDGQLFPTPKPQPYSQADVCFSNTNDATFGSFAYAAPYVYLECEGRGIVALHVDTAAPSFVVCSSTSCPSPNWRAGAGITFGPPIVAAGLVWAATNGGGLYAFRADTGAQVFHSASFAVHRFVTPAEAGGQVFVPADNVIKQFVLQFGTAQSSPAPIPARQPVVPAPGPAAPSRPSVTQSTPAPTPIGR
ncbi:MAG TPA: PQQ-binding-like beta-propeller repeat protein [Candidatus Dormibacteraeota bacterium]|nr:PQQ-binding-like beta-propeller repeat protein [Candidatus Dormibacteraeota bacterium]